MGRPKQPTVMNTEIESLLRNFLAKNILFIEEGDALTDDASFIGEGLIDSIGITELVEYIRQQFGLEIPLGDIVPANFDSITRLANYIRRRMAEGKQESREVVVGMNPSCYSQFLRSTRRENT